MTGVSVRTLRYYVQLKLLEPSEFRGTITRYQRLELLRLLGILRMKSEARVSLSEIRRKLRALSERELEAWLATGPVPAAAAAALGITVESARSGSLGGAAETSGETPLLSSNHSPARLGRGPVETWHRVCLLPGLELMVSCDATPATMRAAQSICDDYVGR
jgi:DNA-binding transcriptional MerR regulator